MCFYLQCRYAEPCRDLLLHDVGLYILNQSSFSILILVNMNFYWGLLFLAKFCSFHFNCWKFNWTFKKAKSRVCEENSWSESLVITWVLKSVDELALTQFYRNWTLWTTCSSLWPWLPCLSGCGGCSTALPVDSAWGWGLQSWQL